MSTTLTNITTKVRYLLGDIPTTGTDMFTYTTSNVFTLTESNGISVEGVYLNNEEMGASELAYDSTTNKVTVNLSMNSGDTVQIEYIYYPNFSDTEIEAYIRAALIHISANGLSTIIVENDIFYPDINLKIQNLISMIASLLIEPDNKTYRLPDVTIVVPKDLPVYEKIRRTISIYKHNSHGIFSTL